MGPTTRIVRVVSIALATPVVAQVNPVYTDDSPAAAETLTLLPELLAAGNYAQAVSTLQALLDTEAERLVRSADDALLYESVRDAVHAALKSSPALLARYRQLEGPEADRRLRAGDVAGVERSRLMTRAGAEAALRLAQQDFELARFEAARLRLEQLAGHPDAQRGSDVAGDVASLQARLVRYLPRPELIERAAWWHRHAGVPLPQPWPPEPVARPRRAADVVINAYEASPNGPDEPVPPAGLWSVPLDPVDQPTTRPRPAGAPTSPIPRNAENLWVLPSVAGDLVFASDGVGIGAWDRFTLEQRWYLRPDSSGIDEARRRRDQPRIGVSLEDANTVTYAGPPPDQPGGTLVVATGLAYESQRDGDPRVHAIDARTGRRLWSVDPAALDPRLTFATVRGTLAVDADTVLVALRKVVQARRLMTLYLVGLDLHTGQLRFVRLLASAGALPNARRLVAGAPVVADGLYYRVEQLGGGGVIAAIESATGRPRWVRVVPSPEPPFGRSEDIWAANVPIIHGDQLLVLAPDGSAIFRLDRATGRLLESRSAAALGQPDYLVAAGGYLAAVGADRIVVVPLDDLGAAARSREGFRPAGIRGRVRAVGDRLLVPHALGATLLDPGGETPDQVFPLDRPGNVLPVGETLLVVDDFHLHSHLNWATADRILTQRMQAEPLNPAPAVTYVELAYRAGRPERIPWAADHAIDAIERAPLEPANAAARQRLVGALLDMATETEWSWTAADGRTPSGSPPVASLELLAEILQRVDRAAEQPAERAAFLLALGRLREAQNSLHQAVEAYQRILSDAQLAAAPWRRDRLERRAEREATQRLRALVERHGPAIYDVFDAEAQRRLAQLDASASIPALEQMARQYPLSRVVPGLWLRVADRHERAGRRFEAVESLQRALEAALFAHRSTWPPPREDLAEIAGRLVSALEASERAGAAAETLRRLDDAGLGPLEAELTAFGQPIDIDALRARLAARLAALARRPRIGPALDPAVQTLQGWELLVPLSLARAPSPEHVLLLAPLERRIALWGSGGSAADAGPIRLLWDRPFDQQPPTLLRIDPQSVWLFWSEPQGPSIERIQTVGGEVAWRTPPLPGPTPVRDPAHAANVMPGQPRFDDSLVVLRDRVVAIARRNGDLATFDPDTGELLWFGRAGLSVIHDMDATGELVLLVGSAGVPVRTGTPAPGAVRRGGGPDAADDARAVPTPELVACDARTGQVIHRLPLPGGNPRWLRAGDDLRVLVGMDSGVAAFDLARVGPGESPPAPAPEWFNQSVELQGSLGAWRFDDAPFVLDQRGGVWFVSMTSGTIQPALDRLPLTASIHATRLEPRPGADHADESFTVAVTSASGVALLSPQGRLVAMDALGLASGLLPPVPAEDLFVALATRPSELRDTRPIYELSFLDQRTLRLLGVQPLVLWQPPEAIAVIDGAVVVTAGGNSFAYRAPPDQSP